MVCDGEPLTGAVSHRYSDSPTYGRQLLVDKVSVNMGHMAQCMFVEKVDDIMYNLDKIKLYMDPLESMSAPVDKIKLYMDPLENISAPVDDIFFEMMLQ
jgi:hypothetical protein